jgi:D-3-phosphoglycerate dehydrogenase
MPNYHILITDYAWDTLDIERSVFDPIGAELLVAETGEEAELLRLAPHADAIMTNWKRVSAATLDAASNCVTVARYGVGVDNIAVDRATELGILVSNVPDYCVEEVSDHTLALLLACARSVATFDRDMGRGEWNLTAGRPLFRLRGKTLGLIGYGNIARAVVPKAMGFGLNILVYQRSRNLVGNGITLTTDLEHVLRESDYLSLHVPLTADTKGMVDAAFLRRMKPTAYLINTSRGAVIDEAALAQALRDRVIRGAALDVLTQEPPPADHPLLGLPNALITPHAAFNSVEAVEELQARTAQHVADVLTGKLPPFVINPAVLESANLRMKR